MLLDTPDVLTSYRWKKEKLQFMVQKDLIILKILLLKTAGFVRIIARAAVVNSFM
jgi:hypothetical protein